ncbi:MAG TPA: hypothetical protein VLF93_07260 [Candidatus Saccharimonadales bacterium]|nr:hypothetical protein [Candidatus Saccharimonadales bacterium]
MAVKTPDVVPAPKSNSVDDVVVTQAVDAVAAVPDEEELLSKGADVSRPPYSLARRSTNCAGVANVTVTVLAFAAEATIFFA